MNDVMHVLRKTILDPTAENYCTKPMYNMEDDQINPLFSIRLELSLEQ